MARPRAEVTDQSGRVILITGANTGIGEETAKALAAAGAHVLLACRTEAKAAPVREAIQAAGGQATFLPLDLASLASVRECARRFEALDLPLHTLINNAGLVTPGQTRDGFELIFGVNHLGHFLLTQLLLPALKAEATPAQPARVVHVASVAHTEATRIDWEALRRPTDSMTGMPEYRVSKLANILFSDELARRLGDAPVRSYALHPGVVASDIWRRVPWPLRPLITSRMLTTVDGAQTTLHCAASAEAAGETGLYYDRCAPRSPSALAQDRALAATLWRHSEEWTTP